MKTNFEEFSRLTHLLTSSQKNTPKDKAKVFGDVLLSLEKDIHSEQIKQTFLNFLLKMDLKTSEQLARDKNVLKVISEHVCWDDVFNIQSLGNTGFQKMELLLPKIESEKFIEVAKEQKYLQRFSTLVNYALKNDYHFKQEDWSMFEVQFSQYAGWEQDPKIVSLFLSAYFSNPQVDISSILTKNFKGFTYLIQMGNFSHEKIYLKGKKFSLTYELFEQFYSSLSTNDFTINMSKLDLSNFISGIQHKMKLNSIKQLFSHILTNIDDKTKVLEIFQLTKHKNVATIFLPIVEQILLEEKLSVSSLKEGKKLKI